MASVTFIGESGDSHSTWGSLRAPLFVCQVGISIPEYFWDAFATDCWADYTKHSAGYLKPYSELLKANWFGGPYPNGGLSYSTYGTNIGANFEYIEDYVNAYLAVGISVMYSWYMNPPDPGSSKMYDPDWTVIGNSYDYETTKSRLIGGVVSITIGSSSYTVTIDEDMFPVDFYPNPSPESPATGGSHIATIPTEPGMSLAYTVDSVTLP